MKQFFDIENHNKFKKYFEIKKEESDIEKDFYLKSIKYLKFIKWIPGIRMVGIGNSISMNCATKDSDIDLYIVTTNNSMWLNRIIITFTFQILGVRKTPKKHSSRFCLSFFSTLDGMDFGKFNLENDIYLYFWIIYFKPILSYNNTYEDFIEKNNSWADFSKYNSIIENNKKYINYSGIKAKNGIIISFLDNIIKNIFLRKTLNHFEKIGKPYGVIINENLLKFHNGDIREKTKKELL